MALHERSEPASPYMVFLGQDGSPYLGFRDLRHVAAWVMLH